MDLQSKINELRKKKEELLAEQEQLIEDIKTRHRAFYDWMVETKIDPRSLGKYAVNISAAFIFTFGALTPSSPPDFYKPSIPPPPPEVVIIKPEELSGKTDEEKAAMVWQRYGFVIKQVAGKYSLDPNLIFATIMLESGGNTYAIRYEPQINDTSYGLGQILYGTARSMGFEGTPEQLYDPEINIDLIGKYHRYNLDTYGNNLNAEQLTIAYNSGSPYNHPYPGHLNKFRNWFDKVRNLVV
jgi:hypothetical protein